MPEELQTITAEPTAVTNANTEPSKSDTTPDLAAALAAVQAELAAMKAERQSERDAAEARAKAEADAKLTDAQKAQAKIEALEARMAEQDRAMAEATRTALLDSLGVDPAYRKVFPPGDARDPKVKAEIEKFAADHPRLSTRQPGPPQPQVPNVADRFKTTTGKKSSLVNETAVQASYEAMTQIIGR